MCDASQVTVTGSGRFFRRLCPAFVSLAFKSRYEVSLEGRVRPGRS